MENSQFAPSKLLNSLLYIAAATFVFLPQSLSSSTLSTAYFAGKLPIGSNQIFPQRLIRLPNEVWPESNPSRAILNEALLDH